MQLASFEVLGYLYASVLDKKVPQAPKDPESPIYSGREITVHTLPRFPAMHFISVAALSIFLG